MIITCLIKGSKRTLDVNPGLMVMLNLSLGSKQNGRFLIDDIGDQWRFEQAYLKRYGHKPMIEEVVQ